VTAPVLAPHAVSLVERGRRAAAVADAAADDVDACARFPHEAIDALRAEGLLGFAVPVSHGGEGAGLREVAGVIEQLGRACGATATIFAMHQIQVACLAQHPRTPALDRFLERVATEGLLVASATTERGKGGDVRSSRCAVERTGRGFRLVKQAPVISFGEYADAVFATARRTPESPDNDQVLVLCTPPGLLLEPTSTWDTLGYRGSCSRGFVLHAEGDAELVQPASYALVAARTMVPVTHILWGAAWVGLASAAAAKARRFVQDQARKQPGALPPAAVHLAELTGVLQQLRALVGEALRLWDSAEQAPELFDAYTTTIALNALKVVGSALVLDVVTRALLVVGMAGYAQGTPFSLGRLLRDAHGAALMLSNDRLTQTNAALLMATRGD